MRLALLVALFAALPATAADPPSMKELSPAPVVQPKPDDPVPVDVGLYRFFAVEGYTGAVTWESDGTSVGIKEVTKPFVLFGRIHGQPAPGEYDVPAGAVVVWGVDKGTTKLTAYGVVDGKAKRLLSKTFIVGESPRPPPDDPRPPPDDPKPPPQPVTSFRVIFVKESGKTLPAAQNTIPTAQVLWDYLTAKTTPEGGKAGFREYDPQTNATNDQPTMRALWAAVQPKITTVPCVVIQVNEKAEIIPWPANAAEALATIKKYAEGR